MPLHLSQKEIDVIKQGKAILSAGLVTLGNADIVASSPTDENGYLHIQMSDAYRKLRKINRVFSSVINNIDDGYITETMISTLLATKQDLNSCIGDIQLNAMAGGENALNILESEDAVDRLRHNMVGEIMKIRNYTGKMYRMLEDKVQKEDIRLPKPYFQSDLPTSHARE